MTYGLERIAAFLQDVDSIYDIVWARDPETGAAMTYGDVRLNEELQFSVYNFEYSGHGEALGASDAYEAECQALLAGWSALAESPEARAAAVSALARV